MNMTPNVEEFKTLEKVLSEYCLAAIPGDISVWKTIFHDNAVWNGFFKDGSKLTGSVENLYKRRENMPFNHIGTYHIDIFEIVGNIAAARCVLNNLGHKDYVDYHELIKEDGRWRIIGKVSQELLDEEPGRKDYAVVRGLIEDCSKYGIPDNSSWRNIFREDVTVNGYFRNGDRLAGSIGNLLELRKASLSTGDNHCEADVLQICGNMALGRGRLFNYGGKDFVEFHELIKEDGQWHIVSTVFQEI